VLFAAFGAINEASTAVHLHDARHAKTRYAIRTERVLGFLKSATGAQLLK
jgi:hypothetical protein